MPANVVRLGGPAAILAGALLVIGEIFNSDIDFENFSQAASTDTYLLQAVLFLLAAALLLIPRINPHNRIPISR